MALGAGPAAAALSALSSVYPRLGRREADGADKRAVPPGPRPSAARSALLRAMLSRRCCLYAVSGSRPATQGHDALSMNAVDTRGPTATSTSHTGTD